MIESVSDTEILHVIEQAIEDGATDAGGGGVPVGEVAYRLGYSTQTPVYERLHELAEEGRVERVCGLNRASGQWRESYLLGDT